MTVYNSFAMSSNRRVASRFIPDVGYTILCTNWDCLLFIARGEYRDAQAAYDHSSLGFIWLTPESLQMIRDAGIDTPQYPSESVHIPKFSELLEKLTSRS